MPPITEKRSPTIKNNIKENVSVITCDKYNGTNRGPEILDFRESWLQEIELYKDQIKSRQPPCKHDRMFGGVHYLNDDSTNLGNGDNRVMDLKNRQKTPPRRIQQLTTTGEELPFLYTSSANSSIAGGLYNSNSIKKISTRRNSEEPQSTYKKLRGENGTYLTSTPNSPKQNKTSVSPDRQTKRQNEQDAHNSQINDVDFQKILYGHSSSPTRRRRLRAKKDPSRQENDNQIGLLNASLQQNPQQRSDITQDKEINPNNNSNNVTSNGMNVNNIKQRRTPTPTSFLADAIDSANKNFVGDANENNSYQEGRKSPRRSPTFKLVESYPAASNKQATEITGNNIIYTSTKETSEEKSHPPAVEFKSDSDCNFDYLDDEIGDCDGAVSDSSSDSEDEYTGTPFYFNLTEEVNTTIVPPCNEYSVSTTPPLTASLFPYVPPYLTFCSHTEAVPALNPILKKVLKWKLSPVTPRIIRRIVFNSGFRLIKKTNDWIGTWEKHMKSPCFKSIKSHQKFNHLPGTFRIGRKDCVWKNLKSFMAKHSKMEFGFMKKTFILPQDLEQLQKAWARYARKNAKWILKPPASARGSGISVVDKWCNIPKSKPLIVQRYIERPLLINGNKFDLRLYVLVTSVNPLRIYMHPDGLARFASVQYNTHSEDLNDRCMHLTNYSINKLSLNYAKNEDINACQGHKWTLKALWTHFEKQGINTSRIWGTLRSLVIKTLVSGESSLNKIFKLNVRNKYNCYELFGFDVILDENLVPWLLEVNISPSLHSDLPLDLHIKGSLIQGVLNTAMYQVPPKLTSEEELEILNAYKLSGSLCYDHRLYTTTLSPEEIKKHNQYTSRAIEFREEYIDTILDDITPDDLRCLIISEDELSRCCPLERIFPGPECHKFLKYLEGPRYYNRLLDAFETRYGTNRAAGRELIKKLCQTRLHLEVPESVLRESPDIDISDSNMELSSTMPTNTREVSNTSTNLLTSTITSKDNSSVNTSALSSLMSSIGSNTEKTITGNLVPISLNNCSKHASPVDGIYKRRSPTVKVK